MSGCGGNLGLFGFSGFIIGGAGFFILARSSSNLVWQFAQ